MATSAKKAKSADRSNERLGRVLISIGVEKEVVKKILPNPNLRRITVPIYSKTGISADSHKFCLVDLPRFLTWFEKKFPDGVLRWDPDYEAEGIGENHVAIHVTFDFQEDDQGRRQSIKPTPLDEESYHEKLRECTYKKEDAVPVHKIIYGR